MKQEQLASMTIRLPVPLKKRVKKFAIDNGMTFKKVFLTAVQEYMSKK